MEAVLAKGIPDRVLNYGANFVGIVLPGDELAVKAKRTAMRGAAHYCLRLQGHGMDSGS